MKITIAYLTEEEREADLIARLVRGLCGLVKMRKSDTHPPYKHIYLTTKKPGKPSGARENA